MNPEIIGEDNHLIVANKPAGWVTQGAMPGVASLYDAVCAYVREKYRKPGNVFLGVVSRLDAPVSGVVCFARTSKAAARLNEQFRERHVRKIYLAVTRAPQFLTDAEPGVTCGCCENFLYHDDAARRVRIVREGVSGARFASLDWRLCAFDPSQGHTLLAVELHTGRKHQIRVQLASHGMPIVGDTLYENIGNPLYAGRSGRYDEKDVGRIRIPDRIRLHAWRLTLEHPVRREPTTFEAPVPDRFFPRDRIPDVLKMIALRADESGES